MNTNPYLLANTVFLLLAIGSNACRSKAASAPYEPEPPERSAVTDDSLVVVDVATKDRLLEDWRWKVGSSAKVFRVTLFGDIFTLEPDGKVYWLDTGTGSYAEVAPSADQWVAEAEVHGPEWFRSSTVSQLRSLALLSHRT